MLGKLLKYDLKWSFKFLIVFYILALISAIAIRVVESFEQTMILVIIDKICCGIGISMLINIIVNCFMRNWARFIKNVYKDESYLTHTLPVSKGQIYLSKILSSIITIIVSLIVILICIAIGALNEETWSFITAYFENIQTMFNISPVGLIITLLGTVLFETIFMYFCGILGIVIGHSSNNSKMVKSIVLGIVIYIALSNIAVGIVFGIGLFNSDIMSLFNTTEVSPVIVNKLVNISVFIYAFYDLLIYFVGSKLLKKGVNID